MFRLVNNGHHCMMMILQEGEAIVVSSLWSVVLNLSLGSPRSLMNKP